MGRGKKAGPKASPPKAAASDEDEKPLKETLASDQISLHRKVDDSKTEWLDASSIDRSQKIISLDNHKRFKPTSDIIPHDKKGLLSKELFVLFKEPDDADPSHYGSMYRGIVKRFVPKKAKGENHYIEFYDGDKSWHNLPEETVIWPDGTVTGPGSKWKEEPETENKNAAGGVSGKKRGRPGRKTAAAAQEEAEAEDVVIEAEKHPKKEELRKPVADAEPPQAAAIPLFAEEPGPAAEESKKRKAPTTDQNPEAVEPLAPVIETASAAAAVAEVPTAAPPQELEKQQPAMASPKKEIASPEKQQPAPATDTIEIQPKKAKVEHQKLPHGTIAIPPPPPPPGVPPSRRDLAPPSTTTVLGPSKPQGGHKEQEKHQQKKQQVLPALPTDPKLAALQQKHRQLKDSTDKYLAALDTLKNSSETIKSLVKDLESEDMLGKNKAGIPKLVFHVVKNALQPPSSNNSGGGGGGGSGGTSNVGWFELHGTKWLNDVPEAMASMRELLNTWCASSNKPQMPEGPQLKAWVVERSRRAAGEGAAGDKKPALQQQQQHKQQQQTQQKQQVQVEEEADQDLIPSTGHEMRDKVVRVLAHALVTATTPIDAAREMEQSLFYQLCLNKIVNTKSGAGAEEKEKERSTPEPTEAYYDRMRTIWEALSPKSPTCHPFLRYMLLTGVISPSELVNITAERLKMKQEEVMKELIECRPGWLAEQLRNVQLPYYPKHAEPAAPAPAAAAAREVSPPAEETGPLEAGAPALLQPLVGTDEDQGAEGSGPKAVDMEVD